MLIVYSSFYDEFLDVFDFVYFCEFFGDGVVWGGCSCDE